MRHKTRTPSEILGIPDREKLAMRAKKLEWHEKFHDQLTGNRLENWISLDEYTRLDKPETI